MLNEFRPVWHLVEDLGQVKVLSTCSIFCCLFEAGSGRPQLKWPIPKFSFMYIASEKRQPCVAVSAPKHSLLDSYSQKLEEEVDWSSNDSNHGPNLADHSNIRIE